jgi:integrase
MASLYFRGNIIWIKYRSADGETVRESTKLKRNVPEQLRRARVLEAQRSLKESEKAIASDDSRWQNWVLPYIHTTYGSQSNTLRNYLYRWNPLSIFLKKKGLNYPAQVEYKHCHEYLEWRTKGDMEFAIRKACYNTARGDLIFLGMIMSEAVRREFCLRNTCANLHLKQRDTKEKKPLSTEDIRIAREALKSQPEWARVQFEISLHTGCRINETVIDLDEDIDLDAETLTFRDPKGGKDKDFTVPINPGLLPLLKKLKAKGRKTTHDVPRTNLSLYWQEFFKRLKMPFTFHCLRVTFITQARRAGIDRWTVMKLVNHASATVHEIYQRYDVRADLKPAHAKIRFPATTEEPVEDQGAGESNHPPPLLESSRQT